MAIEWDALIAEMTILAAIIYGSIYVGNWMEKRKVHQDNKEEANKIIMFVTNDLTKKLRFIDESIQYKDFKPIFTDLWDAILLGGKQGLLPFERFENLQHTYSWIKHYNNELEQMKKGDGEEQVLKILKGVKTSIEQSLSLLNAGEQSQ
jgi:hypothetical protein